MSFGDLSVQRGNFEPKLGSGSIRSGAGTVRGEPSLSSNNSLQMLSDQIKVYQVLLEYLMTLSSSHALSE